jgi:hypothetical protein
MVGRATATWKKVDFILRSNLDPARDDAEGQISAQIVKKLLKVRDWPDGDPTLTDEGASCALLRSARAALTKVSGVTP